MAQALLFLDDFVEYYVARLDVRIQRRRLRDTMDPFTLEEDQFHQLFRVSKIMARDLSNELRPYITRSRSHGLSVELQVLCALRFFATGSYQRPVGQDFLISVSQSTTSLVLGEVIAAMHRHLVQQWIKFPATQVDRNKAQRNFRLANNPFPGAMAAIDCTHIPILAPKEHEENYINRHGYHSLNVQMICGADMKIFNVCAKFPGSRHDAGIWMQCPARAIMEMWHGRGERNIWILGDSGYPNEPWLLTPLPHAEPMSPENRYTIAHCKARAIVERLFGVMKATWRCLSRQRILMYEPRKASKIILACAVLHNMRLRYRLPELHDEDEGVPVLNVVDPGEEVRAEGRARIAEGHRVRRALIMEHFNF